MIPFLKAISQAYTSHYHDLSDICFLFPNKRSGTFFLKYLKEESNGMDVIAPQVFSITDFVTSLSGKVVAPRIEQLFILFKAYLKINEKIRNIENTIDFEAFRNWGDIILGDFNLVDQYLVDPKEIFKNVKDYREIATDFLTEDQKDVLREYFGQTEFVSFQSFWKHFNNSDNISELKSKFLNLWQILSPLYEEYTFSLAEKGYASPGGIYRLALENLKKEGRDILRHKKIVVVGFNALSMSERLIFQEMKSFEPYPEYESFVDFIWDATGPILSEKDNSASKFIQSNLIHFPMPEWIDEFLGLSQTDDFPDIKVISSPSNVAQVKIASLLLKDYYEEKGGQAMKDAEVVLVLPDEQLLSPALYSLPKEIGSVNLTMGYPFRLTSVSAYMALLRRTYTNMRWTNGQSFFFHKDIALLMAHPFSYILYGSGPIEKLSHYVKKYHKITLSLTEISSFLPLASQTLDFPQKDSTPGKLFSFLYKQIELLNVKLRENQGSSSHISLEQNHLEIYRDYLKMLENAVIEYEMNISPSGLMILADRLLSAEKISFEGEPLSGLQVMGTLETRSLDFKDVYIVSMNEGKFPGRARTKTFIPESIRKAFGLPPAFYSEEIFAYYFFRLISRAQRVTLIYDSRNTNGAKGGESRYLLQLKYFTDPSKIKIENWNFHIHAKKNIDASIEKNNSIKRMLDAFLPGYKGKKKVLSAASLNTYRECQVKFFLSYVLGLNPDRDPGETIDPITIGIVLHEVMMELYLEEDHRKVYLYKPLEVDKTFLSKILDETDRIYKSVQRKINHIYFKRKGEDLDLPLSGSAEIIARQITQQVITILNHDFKLAPFDLLGCEIEKEGSVKLNSGRVVNFRFGIDRLDRINENGIWHLRIVDYKTGSKKRNADCFDEVFGPSYAVEQLFQLFIYAWLLEKFGIEKVDDIITEIYFVPDMNKNERGLPRIGGEEISGFAPYKEAFSKGLENMIEELFSSEKFLETRDTSNCRLCSFRRLCHK